MEFHVPRFPLDIQWSMRRNNGVSDFNFRSVFWHCCRSERPSTWPVNNLHQFPAKVWWNVDQETNGNWSDTEYIHHITPGMPQCISTVTCTGCNSIMPSTNISEIMNSRQYGNYADECTFAGHTGDQNTQTSTMRKQVHLLAVKTWPPKNILNKSSAETSPKTHKYIISITNLQLTSKFTG